MKIYYYTLILLGLIAYSCKDKDPEPNDNPEPVVQEARVNLVPTYNGQAFEFNTNYTTQEGYTIEFTKLNVIMTNFSNNGNTLFTSGVYKYEDDSRIIWEGPGDYSLFSSMTANIGVPASENHEDPSARPSSDPLNILNTDDMHWGWNSGYIFLMIEGKADTSATQNGQNLMNFLYHVGNDEFLTPVALQNLTWTEVNSSLHQTNIYVDMYKVFDGDTTDVDAKSERSSHTMPGQEPLSDKVISNFASALSSQ
jgi:hypothetical protein